MKMTKLRKLLKDNKKCNPFNDNYDEAEMITTISQQVSVEEFSTDPLRYTIGITGFMNLFYKDFYGIVKEKMYSANVPHKDFVELLFVALNRNYLVVLKKQIELFKKQGFTQDDFYKLRLTTLNEGMGPVEINSSLEVEVDALTYVLNYTRYFRAGIVTIDPRLPDIHTIKAAQNIALTSAYYTMIKSTYDESIWTYGHWIKRTEDPKTIFDVIYPESDLLLANKVGLIRLQKNATSGTIQLISQIMKKTPLGRLVTEVARARKKPKQVDRITIDKGYIIPELKDGISEEQDFLEIKNSVELDTFYAFLDNPALTKLNDLQLLDLVKLFSMVQYLIKQAAFTEFNDGIEQLSDITGFPIKVARTVLHDYLQQCTEYRPDQLDTFINLIASKYGDRLNLWDRPLVQYEEDLYITYLPLLNPILLNFVDYWLDEGGFSLDERGILLEKYLNNVIEDALPDKGYQWQIPSSSKIYNKLKQFEEIDFLLNLKDIVLIAEVKCIKYPFEARDHHNALNRLKEAAEQVKRKMAFLKLYESEITDQIGEMAGKTILPIIITNYPIYSTFKIDDVLITDFYLIEGYFSDGVYTEAWAGSDGNSEVIKKHHYYTNENEMNQNLPGYLQNPPAVTTLKKMFEIRPFKVSMDDLDYDIYVTSAQLKDVDPKLVISHLDG